MKRTLFLTFVLLASYVSPAQVSSTKASLPTKEINREFAIQMNHAFDKLNKSKIPHGLLLDFAMEFVETPAFNGQLTNDNYTDAGTYLQLYYTLLMARIHTNATGFVTPQVLQSAWHGHRQQDKIVLSGLYYQYSKFKDNAHSSGLVSIKNGQFYDVYAKLNPWAKTLGIWRNPYEEKAAFAMAPAITRHTGLHFQVALPADLWLTNAGSAVTSVAVDFADGLGYRTVTSAAVNVNYANAGTYDWKYRLSLADGSKLYSHSKIYIKKSPRDYLGGSPLKNQKSILATPTEVDEIFEITATEEYLGSAATGTVSINYATGTALTQPLIVAEGFDSGTLLKPEDEFGDRNIDNFLRDVIRSVALDDLLGEANQQFDVIYVDWHNGVDHIQRNALLLEEVIRWVNDNKPAGIDNVVLGQSMGGLVARYALRNMENNGEDHETRLFVSHDAPHQGANVPLGYQFLGRHALHQYVQAPFLLGLFETIIPFFTKGPDVTPLDGLLLQDTPAAQQMLANRIGLFYQLDNNTHDAWQTELQNMGYPQQTTNVALSNGSECGLLQALDTGGSLFSYHGKGSTRFLADYVQFIFPGTSVAAAAITSEPAFLLGLIPGKNTMTFDFDVSALPQAGSQEIYSGKIKYTKKVLWLVNINTTITDKKFNSPLNMLPFDSYAGGVSPANVDLENNVVKNWFIKYNIQATQNPNFSFVSTPSALDIGSGNVALTDNDYTARYVSDIPLVAPRNTPFDRFVTAFGNGDNEPHISFWPRNGDWLAEELNDANRMVYNCAFMCDNAEITGSATLCNTATYSVPAGGNVVWTATPAGRVALAPNGNQVVVTPVQNGNFTLTASITSAACGNAPAVLSRTIWSGRPGTPITNPSGYPTIPMGLGQILSVSLVSSPGVDANTANWWSTGSLNPVFACSNSSHCAFEAHSYGQGGFFVQTSNDCGTSPIGGGAINVSSGGCNTCPLKVVSPVPARNQLNIKFLSKETGKVINKAFQEEREYLIHDMFGSLIFRTKSKASQLTLDLRRITRNGMYILTINHGAIGLEKETFIIDR